MKKWKAVISYEVVEYVEAESYEEAMDKIDFSGMRHEFIYGHSGGDFSLEEVEE